MAEHEFDSLLQDYYLEARERLREIEEGILLVGSADTDARAPQLIEIRRQLHTLKGNSAMMGLRELQQLAHNLEDQVEFLDSPGKDLRTILEGVDRFRSLLEHTCGRPSSEEEGEEGTPRRAGTGAAIEESVRVPFVALDVLVDLLMESVIARNRLEEAMQKAQVELDKSRRGGEAWDEIENSRSALDGILDEIHRGVMRMRMTPLEGLFPQLRRIVYDESLRLQKQVRFESSGGDTPLDRSLHELANDALGHLVRNAVIHGIEPPQERERMGKSPQGVVKIQASERSQEILVDVEDDGRGIDRMALVEAAKRRGLEVPPDADLPSLIFLPGLSSLDAADTSAGRGLGLSAAVEAVHRRGGNVEVVSIPGEGTRFRIRLPLTASILRSLLTTVDGECYAIPLSAIHESVSLSSESYHQMNHVGVFRWREQMIPLLDLGLRFGTAPAPRREGFVVVIGIEGNLRGLVVDEILEVRDVVVKRLDDFLGSPPGVAGCTILGDGRVIMILDPVVLASLSPVVEQAS